MIRMLGIAMVLCAFVACVEDEGIGSLSSATTTTCKASTWMGPTFLFNCYNQSEENRRAACEAAYNGACSRYCMAEPTTCESCTGIVFAPIGATQCVDERYVRCECTCLCWTDP